MNCTRCGNSNPDEKRFCGDCGTPLANACPQCGAVSPPGKRFCADCGAALRDADDVPARMSPPPPEPPRAQPPQHLADRILRARAALEGERKQVTVLFADVQGSMDLAAQLDPEAWSQIMQRFFTILADGVQRFEGFVDKFTGDGIMALFGAPIAHEDHARRACFAALQLRDELARYATEVKRAHGVGLSTRMGLNSGEVVVGAIGDDLRMSYTAQGHTVGLAQRMESLASPDSCYLTSATASLVGGYVQLEDLGEFRVKGSADPVHVHRLVAAGHASTRLDVSRSRGLSSFVGRDADMATLEAALAQAQAGHGQVVGIVAPAGTGKSRLCWEFAERCRARGIAVNEGHAVPHGKGIPYLPMLQVFRAYYGIDERDDDATVREKIAGRLLLLDEAFRDVLPVLFELFGVPDPERPVPRMDPDAKQRQVFAVLRRIVQDRRSGADRMLALVEDLHWFDPASEALLAQWVDAIVGSSGLLVVNFRPEHHAEWMQRSWYRQIPLAPLDGAAIRALLDDLIGAHESTRGLADEVHARTGGNPFFLEEVVQSLIESGQLAGTRGAYRLATPVARLDVPPSVQSLLAARIDRLGDGEKQLLQTAAVIGREFSAPLLRRVLAGTGRGALANGTFAAAIDTLKERELVYETALFPDATYAFKHPLTHEVALSSQLQERRRALHAAVADALEAMHADRIDEQAALIAHHRAAAGQAIAAAAWHDRAAVFLLRRSPSDAGRHWQSAREQVRLAADDPRAPVAGASACFRVLSLAFRLGIATDAAQAVFEEGLARAARTGDPLWEGRMHQAMSVFQTSNARPRAGLRHGAEWRRIASALPDPELRAYALWPTLAPLAALGEVGTLRANCEQQIAWTEAHPEWGMRDWGISTYCDALYYLGFVETFAGTLDRARLLSERIVETARRVRDPDHEVWGIALLADVGVCAGEPDLARTAIERATRLSEPLGAASAITAHGRLGRQLLLERRPQDAIAALEHAIALCGDGNRLMEPWLQIALAEAWLEAGEGPRARTLAADALARSLDIGGHPGIVGAALALSAALRADARAGAGANAMGIEELLALADGSISATGARNMIPLVLVERAALAASRGDARQQAEFLRGAHTEFARMGATGQVRRTAVALTALGAPP